MSRIVTSTEAKSSLGELLKWASEHNEGVIIKHYGEPTAALVSYEDFKQLQQIKAATAKRRFALGLRMMRTSMQMNMSPQDSDEEAFRAAGFTEEVIRDLLTTEEEADDQQSDDEAK